jgi:processive 1,2-diacylglycerol beta-glucosyltransferase
VLVENAGGLMAMEGMATGLPVATYRPIPGHGHISAATLEQAGVSTWIRRPSALRPTLLRLLDGDLGSAQRLAAAPMLQADPADLVARIARPPGSDRRRERAWPAIDAYRSGRAVAGEHRPSGGAASRSGELADLNEPAGPGEPAGR